MRLLVSLLACLCMLTAQAAAEEIVSEYTQLDPDLHCSTFAAAEDGEGDWANLACAGYRGYPVIIQYSDARESLSYGFPPAGDLAPVWESFEGFNRSGPTIEWRIVRDGARETPFATIHRWFVADIDIPEDEIEVLVIEKVGQIGEGDGCAVGYVAATGNEGANEQARRIADTQARLFACGDQPVVEWGDVPVPPFSRQAN